MSIKPGQLCIIEPTLVIDNVSKRALVDAVAGLVVTTRTRVGEFWVLSPQPTFKSSNTYRDSIGKVVPANTTRRMLIHESWLRPLRGDAPPLDHALRSEPVYKLQRNFSLKDLLP